MQQKEFKTTYTEFSSVNDFSFQDKKLIQLAKDTALNAYAPYSEFKVGASVLLENDEIFTGNNQENAAYPSGLCAERVALFYANANYPKVPVKTIAVCAINKNGLMQQPVPPCGSCRQVLVESESRFTTPIKIILIGEEKLIVLDSVAHLLPFNFKKGYLNG